MQTELIQIARSVAQTHEHPGVRRRAALIELALRGNHPVEARVLDELRRLHAGESLESIEQGVY